MKYKDRFVDDEKKKKKKEYQKRWRKLNRERLLDEGKKRAKEWYNKNKEHKLKTSKDYYEKNREEYKKLRNNWWNRNKDNADFKRYRLDNNIKYVKVRRKTDKKFKRMLSINSCSWKKYTPMSCYICKSKIKLELHHYTKPYEINKVVPLCRKCHMKVHKDNIRLSEVDTTNCLNMLYLIKGKKIEKYHRRFNDDDLLVEVNRNISKELDFEIDKLKKIKENLQECNNER